MLESRIHLKKKVCKERCQNSLAAACYSAGSCNYLIQTIAVECYSHLADNEF